MEPRRGRHSDLPGAELNRWLTNSGLIKTGNSEEARAMDATVKPARDPGAELFEERGWGGSGCSPAFVGWAGTLVTDEERLAT